VRVASRDGRQFRRPLAETFDRMVRSLRTRMGLKIIPVRGKVPLISDWQRYEATPVKALGLYLRFDDHSRAWRVHALGR
jgi:hypothetical protein